MSNYKLTYKPLGSGAILITWPAIISEEILLDIRCFVSKIENIKHKEILDINFIYNSILVSYNYLSVGFDELVLVLKSMYEEGENHLDVVNTVWNIPVCYSEEFGVDLALLSSEKNMSIEEIVNLHCSVTYTVFGIGFLPGFLYLGGLPEKLHFSRKNTPRLIVPKGSVGIGGNQTGIYPQDSPGGWQLIGKSPVNLFDATNEIPCDITPGDRIQFFPISVDEFHKQEVLQLKPTIIHD
ncbi:5-oxoprolinase subunit PxpB [Lutibacter holmesii]|uniref:5-oxoprolinase subunit PxpB n=1 Tax=Lutibacter holmesii TaxID=1137985 RepID=A0ABW3WPW1_9FLAO